MLAVGVRCGLQGDIRDVFNTVLKTQDEEKFSCSSFILFPIYSAMFTVHNSFLN